MNVDVMCNLKLTLKSKLAQLNAIKTVQRDKGRRAKDEESNHKMQAYNVLMSVQKRKS